MLAVRGFYIALKSFIPAISSLVSLVLIIIIIIKIIIIIIITLFNEGYVIKLNKLIYIMAFKTTHTHKSYTS